MIAIIGCGTLGSRTAQLITQHELLLIDHDVVREENIPVQLYKKEDVGMHKATALKNKVRKAIAHNTFLDHLNISLLEEAEVVVDCVDNLETRRLISRYCKNNGIPLVHGAASKDRGVVGIFTKNPCLECLYNDKISIDVCRGGDINPLVADRISAEQAKFVMKAVSGDVSSELFLVYPDRLSSVDTSRVHCSVCSDELTNKEWFLTYCEEAGCMSAKPLKKIFVDAHEEMVDGIMVTVLPHGEVRFPEENNIDVLEIIAKKVYSRITS